MTQNNRDFQSLSGTVAVQAQQRGVPAARPAAGEGGPVRLHRPTCSSALWLYEPAPASICACGSWTGNCDWTKDYN